MPPTSPARSRSRIASASAIALAGLAASATVLVPASGASAASDDLIISEYIEGSSFNKAIEIYNGTGAPVDLGAGGYQLELYSNGAASPNNTNELSGVIAEGDVYVIANSGAGAAILAEADATGSAVNFNGDDALVLRAGDGSVVDSFGQVGIDPGSEWTGGGLNDTLQRFASVCSGDTDPSDAFDASLEWAVLPEDTSSGLGSHSADCGDGTGGGGGDAIVLINEVDADQDGTDSAEFVELHDGGVGGTDLSDTTLVFFNGSNDLAYEAFDLDGLSTDADGYFVLCGDSANVEGCDLDVSPDTNLVQNGADAVALYSGDVAEGSGITTEGLLDAVVYDTNDADDPELLVLLDAGQPQVNEDAGGDSEGESIQRCPNGSGGARVTDTYATWAPTPGAANTCTPPPPPPPPALTCDSDTAITLVSAVQGTGPTTPLAGQTVTVEAVVTADLTDGLNGFYVQEEPSDSDGDPLSSEGLFVFGSDLPDGVVVGDTVRVQGTATEYTSSGSSLTQLGFATVVGCGPSDETITPTVVTLPLESEDALEAVEGMLVTLPQDLTIVEYFNYDRFGEVVVSSQRDLTPTAEFEPGPEAIAALEAYERDRITIDDGRSTQNPDPAIHPGNGEEFTLDNRFRGGDLITGITGVIDETFGAYRLQPTEYGTFTVTNPRPEAPDDVGGDITVASFNVLNYFTTLDTGAEICGPQVDADCRGADTAEELDRQRAKIVSALVAIDADVFGLIEIENDPEDAAVADLVASLNAVVGEGTYAAIQTGTIGTDAIKVALVYDTTTVAPVGEPAILDQSVDPRFLDEKNRPALAQTFEDLSTGGVVTVTVNHLKSKGSSCDDVGDPDSGDGSGNCDGVRTAAAEALVDWLATDPTGSGDPDHLIIGDLNAYDQEDPIDAIREGADDVLGTDDDYVDLVRLFEGEDAYSYVFDGLIGYLDHALANLSLVDQVTGTTVWHINADEPDILDYDTSFKRDAQDALFEPNPYRSSDHDPVIVGLDLCDSIAPTFDELSVTPSVLGPPNGKYVDVQATVVVSDDSDPAPVLELVSVESSDADDGRGDGATADDIVIVDDTTFRLRAERSGGSDGRTYTITYVVTDSCGNSATASTTVEVEPNRGNPNPGRPNR
ncbi:ExeM/NucH family extracellular endonuclease [Ilumatobacter sp.]|uniref:ExeM/NucH family extracellular endonuclease n=1 Tax=Ilumatobacter sp. TaxID=1967498 RepID=UPI003B52F863